MADLKVIVGFVVAYVVALLTLVLSRLVFDLPAEVQFLLPMAASLPTLYFASVAWPLPDSPRWQPGRRRGGRMRASAAVIFTALTLTGMLRESMPEVWPVVVVGLVLPLFYVAQLAIGWRPHRSPSG